MNDHLLIVNIENPSAVIAEIRSSFTLCADCLFRSCRWNVFRWARRALTNTSTFHKIKQTHMTPPLPLLPWINITCVTYIIAIPTKNAIKYSRFILKQDQIPSQILLERTGNPQNQCMGIGCNTILIRNRRRPGLDHFSVPQIDSHMIDDICIRSSVKDQVPAFHIGHIHVTHIDLIK